MHAQRLNWLPGSARCSPAIMLSIASQSSGPISSSTTSAIATVTERRRFLTSLRSFRTPRELSTTRRVRCATTRSRFASRPVKAESNSEVGPATWPSRDSSCASPACVEAFNPSPDGRGYLAAHLISMREILPENQCAKINSAICRLTLRLPTLLPTIVSLSIVSLPI